MSIYLILDAVHGVNTGIVRALGKQFMASVATLICYYAFGMPLAIFLGFKLAMGVKGFWLGFTIALSCQDIIVTLIIITANWEIGSKKRTSDSKAEESCEDELMSPNRLTRQNSLASTGSGNYAAP